MGERNRRVIVGGVFLGRRARGRTADIAGVGVHEPHRKRRSVCCDADLKRGASLLQFREHERLSLGGFDFHATAQFTLSRKCDDRLADLLFAPPPPLPLTFYPPYLTTSCPLNISASLHPP